MGKRTDAQLKAMNDKNDVCAKTAASLHKVLAAWPAIDKEWDKWEDEMRKLPDWEQHPYAKKRIAVWQMGKDLSAKLKTEVNALNVAVSEFRTLIAKKEKSKNIFKSKNSLPSSKDTLKVYDGIVKNMDELAMGGRRVFH